MAAKRSCHSVGFFSDINQLSYADFFVQNSRTNHIKTVDNARLLGVERVIASRRSKDTSVRVLIEFFCLNNSPWSAPCDFCLSVFLICNFFVI